MELVKFALIGLVAWGILAVAGIVNSGPIDFIIAVVQKILVG